MSAQSDTHHEFTISGYVADISSSLTESDTPTANVTLLNIRQSPSDRDGAFSSVLWTEVGSEGQVAQKLSSVDRRQFVTLRGSILEAGFTRHRPAGSYYWNMNFLRVNAAGGHLGPQTHPGKHRHGDASGELHVELAGGGTVSINLTSAVELSQCSRQHCVDSQTSTNQIVISGPVTSSPVWITPRNGVKRAVITMSLPGPREGRAGSIGVGVLVSGELAEHIMENVSHGTHATVFGGVGIVRRRISNRPDTLSIRLLCIPTPSM